MAEEGIVKKVQTKVAKSFSLAKKVLAGMCVWGLIFSIVTIAQLRVAFDYDDTLVFSTPAFQKAFANSYQPFTPQFWTVVNTSYDLEKTKKVPWAMAWMFKFFGFGVTVISSRPSMGGDSLRKEWRSLASQEHFIFAGDNANKHKHLKGGNFLLYFGDSDTDIQEGRKAHVVAIRIRRSPESSYKADYHPGSLGEFVIPFSEY